MTINPSIPIDKYINTSYDVVKTVYDNLDSITLLANSLNGVRIAVIGDSLAAQSPLMAEKWPSILEHRLNALGGASVLVKNFAINGHSYFRANTWYSAMISPCHL